MHVKIKIILTYSHTIISKYSTKQANSFEETRHNAAKKGSLHMLYARDDLACIVDIAY